MASSVRIVEVVQQMPPELRFPMMGLVEALRQDFREEFAVRREDLQALQKAVQDLGDAQARTEEAVTQLTTAQARTEERVARLEEVLQEQIRALREAVEAIQMWQKSTEDRLGVLDGFYLEAKFERKASAILGRVLRKVRIASQEQLESLEQVLPEPDLEDLICADFVVRGRVKRVPGEPEVWAAVEGSSVVDERDVTRAARRAAILRKVGYTAIPIVAGRRLTAEAFRVAAVENVVVITDGASRFWREALTAAGVELPPDWKPPEELY